MKKTEIDKILAVDLGKDLARDGFNYVKATKWLARTNEDITHIVSWSFYASGPGFTVVPGLGIRSQAIFSIFKQVSQVRPEDEKFRRTLSVEIWRLSGNRSRGEFKVTSEEEAHRAATTIAALIRSDAVPFFERCNSVADVDRLFNTDPNSPGARLLSLDNWARTANALIAARLSHNPKYDGLVDAYGTLLAGFSGGQYLKQFEALVALLSKIN